MKPVADRCNPILITSQVELQTTQSVSHAMGTRQSLKLFVAASIDGSDSRGGAAPRKV